MIKLVAKTNSACHSCSSCVGQTSLPALGLELSAYAVGYIVCDFPAITLVVILQLLKSKTAPRWVGWTQHSGDV